MLVALHLAGLRTLWGRSTAFCPLILRHQGQAFCAGYSPWGRLCSPAFCPARGQLSPCPPACLPPALDKCSPIKTHCCFCHLLLSDPSDLPLGLQWAAVSTPSLASTLVLHRNVCVGARGASATHRHRSDAAAAGWRGAPGAAACRYLSLYSTL